MSEFCAINFDGGGTDNFEGVVSWVGDEQANRPQNAQSFYVPPDLQPHIQIGVRVVVDVGQIVGWFDSGEWKRAVNFPYWPDGWSA